MNLKRNRMLVLALGALLMTLTPTIQAQTVSNDVYQALIKREFGTAVDEMTAIEKQIQTATPEELPAIEKRLVAVLEAPDATMPGKQFACQMLRLVGSRQCVPAVAKLLADPQLSHMARMVLLAMDDRSAEAALRDALERTEGTVRIGLVDTIGDRGDRRSLKAVAALLKSGDAALASAALNAIGKIGDDDAADALDRANVPDALKTAWAQAYLRCASGMATHGEAKRGLKMYRKLAAGDYPSQVRAGALAEVVRADREAAVPVILQTLVSPDRLMRRAGLAAVISVPGHAATTAMAKQLAALAPDDKATLIGALAARGDAEGVTEQINALAADENQTVRVSAIKALGRLGTASSIPVLVATVLKDSTNSVLAGKALAELRGPGVVEGLVAQAKEGDPATRAAMLGILGERKQLEALPVARTSVNDGDTKIRQAALRVLAELGTQEDLERLCSTVLTTKDEGERDRLVRAISAIGVRMSDKSARDDRFLQTFAQADAATKVQLFAVLSAFGGAKALQAATESLNAQGEVRKSAVRALAVWPDSAPLGALQKVAKEERDETVKILALRGCIKMIEPARLKTEEKVQAFREVLALSARSDEQRQVLSEIAKIGHEESLKIVEPFLNDEKLKQEALRAYERIAESLAGRQPALAREALQKVVAATSDEGLRDKAKMALEKVK